MRREKGDVAVAAAHTDDTIPVGVVQAWVAQKLVNVSFYEFFSMSDL